jgi:LmbE family N-acetylglucosaminyl deacetylase
VVSPHLDDATLSCAALLARTDAVDVLTVFAGGPDPPWQGSWDYECGFANSFESLLVRRAEEQAAFADTPHRLTSLTLLDAQYVDWQRGDEEVKALGEAIRAWAVEVVGGAVAVPAGAGRHVGRVRARLARALDVGPAEDRHPDHVFVRDVALGVLRELPDVVPILYEELPYAWGGSAAGEARRTAAAGGWQAVEAVIGVDRTAKAARIGAYASQLPHLTLDGAKLDVAANLPPVEHYWRLVRR